MFNNTKIIYFIFQFNKCNDFSLSKDFRNNHTKQKNQKKNENWEKPPIHEFKYLDPQSLKLIHYNYNIFQREPIIFIACW